MKVHLIRSYRSKNGNVTFVYGVTGTKQELEAYREAQGDFFREDEEGTALWFTTRCIGQTGDLIITSTGKIVPDMSKFDQAASLAEQYGGNFGAELARGAAAQLLGAPVAQTSAPIEAKPDVSEEASDDMPE